MDPRFASIPSTVKEDDLEKVIRRNRARVRYASAELLDNSSLCENSRNNDNGNGNSNSNDLNLYDSDVDYESGTTSDGSASLDVRRKSVDVGLGEHYGSDEEIELKGRDKGDAKRELVEGEKEKIEKSLSLSPSLSTQTPTQIQSRAAIFASLNASVGDMLSGEKSQAARARAAVRQLVDDSK